jgi:hypothetical protein
MLGHSNVATTSTYLNAHAQGLAESMQRLDASRCKPVAKPEVLEHRPTRNGETLEPAQPLIQ